MSAGPGEARPPERRMPLWAKLLLAAMVAATLVELAVLFAAATP